MHAKPQPKKKDVDTQYEIRLMIPADAHVDVDFDSINASIDAGYEMTLAQELPTVVTRRYTGRATLVVSERLQPMHTAWSLVITLSAKTLRVPAYIENYPTRHTNDVEIAWQFNSAFGQPAPLTLGGMLKIKIHQ